MNNRPRSGSNGRGSHNGAHNGAHNGNGSSPVIERDRQNIPRMMTQRRRSLSLLPAALICLALGLGLGIFAVQTLRLPSLTSSKENAEAFRWAVNRAMGAAELTQDARSRQEWTTVVQWWQESIALMKDVPVTDAKYAVAQEKIVEYQGNLAYAQQKVRQSAPASPLPSLSLWGIGSFKADILQIQGKPSRSVRYDALCQEVLYYGNSTVELRNGIAIEFNNVDRNLKAMEGESQKLGESSDAPIAPADPNRTAWTLGSDKQEVFRIQGTPSRITPYEATEREVLYYNGSSVELSRGRVVGYDNLANNLRVAIVPVAIGSAVNSWSIGSERNDVFRVQGTPTQVALDSSLCREVLNYGDSTIELKNGVVNGYDNLAKNLRVQAK